MFIKFSTSTHTAGKNNTNTEEKTQLDSKPTLAKKPSQNGFVIRTQMRAGFDAYGVADFDPFLN